AVDRAGHTPPTGGRRLSFHAAPDKKGKGPRPVTLVTTGCRASSPPPADCSRCKPSLRLGRSSIAMPSMLTLRSSPASPFVRKIRIAANVLGLDRDIAIEPADTMSPNDSVRRQNPLGKIPALVLEDGTVLFDSRVILEYLDHRAGGGRIVPNDAGARFAALRLQALADGLMDASILLIYEGRWRPAERHEPKWVDHQAGKVARTLAALEAAPPALTTTPD